MSACGARRKPPPVSETRPEENYAHSGSYHPAECFGIFFATASTDQTGGTSLAILD